MLFVSLRASSDAGLAGYSSLELDEYIFRPIKSYITSVVTLRVSVKAEACQTTGLGVRKEQRGMGKTVRCIKMGGGEGAWGLFGGGKGDLMLASE